ncbi:MAG: hypothetical protein JW931_01985 [Methanomicrobiaceae archaeon]|nr:hypothetical protein [Methanomicrobiaceae archaeon]
MDFVTISGVVLCHSCPVRYYLETRREFEQERIEYTIAKQISYHLGRDLCNDEIWDEIRLINPNISEEDYPLFENWLEKCRDCSWPVSIESDVEIRSNKLGVIGRIDNLFESEPNIGIIRAGCAPEKGIYKSDRIRCALVSICAAETLKIKGEEILLQYIPDGVTKVCKPSPADRRTAIRALSYAKKIDRGYIPEKKNTERCNTCYLKDYCLTKPKKISDLI